MSTYTNRQQKIHSDFMPKSNTELVAMIENRHKYLNEVIEIIEDILTERDVEFPKSEKRKEIETEETQKHVLIEHFQHYKKEENQFHTAMENKSDEEIFDVIKLSNEYDPQAVIAAARVAIDRNLMKESQGYGIVKIIVDDDEERKVNEETEIIEARKKVPIGVLLLVGGIALTLLSYAFSDLTKETYFIFYGAIIAGLGIIIRGSLKKN